MSTSAEAGDLGRTSSISWNFGPSVSVPIFNTGQLEAAVEYAQAECDEYFIAYRAAVLTALQDVENATVALRQEQRRNRTLEAAVRSHRQAASLASTLYQSGSSSFLDMLDAERSLYSAEDAQLQSRVAITTYYIALNKALGGEWSGAVDTRAPEVTDQMTPSLCARGLGAEVRDVWTGPLNTPMSATPAISEEHPRMIGAAGEPAFGVRPPGTSQPDPGSTKEVNGTTHRLSGPSQRRSATNWCSECQPPRSALPLVQVGGVGFLQGDATIPPWAATARNRILRRSRAP